MMFKNLVVGPVQCNCRLIACPETGEAALIDPGDEPESILGALADAKVASGAPVRVKYLFHTHGHLDHIGATRDVRQALQKDDLGPSIWLHRGDEPLYRALKTQGGFFGIEYEEPLPIDRFFEDGLELAVGRLKFSVLHTPGHSPGSVCLRWHEDTALGTAETLFTGDTLFQGSVGRTDLWGANQDQMFRSIHDRILTLDDATRVCPGHGPDSLVGVEKRENPFLI